MVKVKHNEMGTVIKQKGNHVQIMMETETVIKHLLASIKKYCERKGLSNDFNTLKFKIELYLLQL